MAKPYSSWLWQMPISD